MGTQSFVPVNANQYVYSHFKYVSGVPTSEGGVSITKLQILNSLIDSMIQKKAYSTTELSEISDSHISHAHSDILKQENLAKEIPYFLTGIKPSRLFNLEA